MYSSPKWVKDRPNIVSPDNLDKLKRAFESGFVFGEHYFYCGGSASDHWVHNDYDKFLEYLLRSKPGDSFVIWSSEVLLDNHLEISAIKCTASPESQKSLEGALQTIRSFLSQKIEMVVIFCVHDRDSYFSNIYDRLEDFADVTEDFHEWLQPGSEVYAFPVGAIDKKEYILVEAKYPNDKGEVPIGGSY